MTDAKPADHVRENRAYWDARAADWVAAGERNWAASEPSWGIFGVPERDLEMLPVDMTGLRAVELGCGTGYVSAWMARRGAAVTGIDNSAEQLATARRLAGEHDVDLTLLHGDAENTPFEDESFDFAISEYGAAIWCDPAAWLAEAHRILRPGARLHFLGHHPLTIVCSPSDGSLPLSERLVRPYFGLYRTDWTQATHDPGGIEFNMPMGDWFALFRLLGYEVTEYREPRPTEGGSELRHFTTADWAVRFPSEQVWKLRKAAVPG